MDKIIFNSLLKSSRNKYLWFNIISAYYQGVDYIIEYKLFSENGNGKKVKLSDITYKSDLSEFAKKEQSFMAQLIKIRQSTVKKENAVIAKTTII